jgi:hypothetical protein
MLKPLHEWQGSGLDYSRFVTPGDQVDEETIQYFRDILPPATDLPCLLQAGEPISHLGGKYTFTTFARLSTVWTFAGNCHRGCVVEPKPEEVQAQ